MIRFALRIPEELHARLVNQAAADRRSVNSEILHLLEAGLGSAEAANRPDGNSPTTAPLRGKPDSSPA
jgi:plasmid stability protein